MAVRITYSYKNYENCPEASEISFWRSRNQTYGAMFSGMIFFFATIAFFCILFFQPEDWWQPLCIMILSALWFWYLVSPRYDAITQKKIVKALEKKERERKKELEKQEKMLVKRLKQGKAIIDFQTRKTSYESNNKVGLIIAIIAAVWIIISIVVALLIS